MDFCDARYGYANSADDIDLLYLLRYTTYISRGRADVEQSAPPQPLCRINPCAKDAIFMTPE